MVSKKASRWAGKQASRHASRQAGKQAGKEALGRHSVGAMPCRGLLAAKTQLCVFVCVYHTLTVRFKVPQGFLRLPKVPQGYIHMVPLGNPRLLKVN